MDQVPQSADRETFQEKTNVSETRSSKKVTKKRKESKMTERGKGDMFTQHVGNWAAKLTFEHFKTLIIHGLIFFSGCIGCRDALIVVIFLILHRYF